MTERIDAHHHLWDLSVREQSWTADQPILHRTFTLDELRPHLSARGVDATVLVQTVPDVAETVDLLALAADEPLVRGVVGWVDLTSADVTRRLAWLRAQPGGGKLVGVRHQAQDEPDPRWLARPQVWIGLAAVADAGLAYDLLVRPRQFPAALDTARALPQLRFVLDHAGKPPIATGAIEPWQRDMRALAALPNTAVKLSGLITEAKQPWTSDQLRPYVDVLLDAFGPGRVMFGSDWPVCLLAADYDAVLDAAESLTCRLPHDEWAAVFGGAATDWYRLEAAT